MGKRNGYKAALNRANRAFLRGDFNKARKAAQKACKIRPTEPEPLILLGDSYYDPASDNIKNIEIAAEHYF